MAPTVDNLAAMKAARGTFGMWHGISVLLNYAALACVVGATALAAHLPASAPALVAPADKVPV